MTTLKTTDAHASQQTQSATSSADSECCTTGSVTLTQENMTFVASDAEALAIRLKALADPTRLRMLDLLVRQAEPLCVCEINELFSQHQPTISHHLRLLREAGLIQGEKRGVWSYYWATAEGERSMLLVKQINSW